MEKVRGAKIATQNMLMYYYQALVEEGHPDPKREMATELPKMIQLSQEQAQYVQAEIAAGNSDMSIKELLQHMIVLLKEMEQSQTFLSDNVEMVKRTLQSLYVSIGQGDEPGGSEER